MHPQRPAATITLGIREEQVSPGDHIAYFWEGDEQFRDGVRFLEEGLSGDDFCVVFGHDEANQRVLDILSAASFDVEALRLRNRLAVLGGRNSGEAMLGEIAGQFRRALREGGGGMRLLGNIGWGKPGWPGEHSILEFEARVTDAIRRLPCVVVCMYDLASLSGRAIMDGALETHPLTIRGNVTRENPFYLPLAEFLGRRREDRSSPTHPSLA